MSRGTEAGKPSCAAPGGGKGRGKKLGARGKGRNSLYGTWGNEANNVVARFGKLAKSRAIDGCTPAPFLR